MQITYSTKHRTFRSQNHISLGREKNDGWSWIAPLWRVCWLKKKSKFIDPNDTLQNHKLAPIWILRTIIRHIDKSALILNGNSIPHRRIWEFLNDDDDERNISNQPWNRFHRNHWKWWLQKELQRTWFRGNANQMRDAESGPFRPKGSNRH